jgi:hypothetical protein
VVRLVDTAGRDGPATPREVAGHLQAGGFFWLDLEDPGDDELAEFSQSLQLPRAPSPASCTPVRGRRSPRPPMTTSGPRVAATPDQKSQSLHTCAAPLGALRG